MIDTSASPVSTGHDAEESAAALSSMRPIRCLLVEDSRFDRSLVRYSAERGGVDLEFVDAVTLAEARESLAADDFELIILDRRLPDGDGLELPAQMEGAPRNAGVPTIMLTGGDADELAPASAKAGCVGFIAKNDLSPEGLAATVRRALARQFDATDAIGGDAARFGPSEELRLLLGAFSDASREARMKPLAARLMAVTSELRNSLADCDPDTVANAQSALDEISELSLMLWLDLNGADRKPPGSFPLN